MALNLVTTWMQHAFLPDEQITAQAQEHLADVQFDTLVGTGMSGCLIVPRLGPLLGVNWALMRDAGSRTHTGKAVEGVFGERWLFVDDFMETGETLRRVYQVMSRMTGDTSTFAGAYFYANGGKFRSPVALAVVLSSMWPSIVR